MPSSPGYKRDYKRERALQLKSPKSNLAANASRKRARRMLEKGGLVKKGDGKDVDHKNRNPNDNSVKNLRVQPKGTNRSFSRKAQAYKYNKGGYVTCGASNPGTQKRTK
tara:strand:+ start:117 stop:443 length:327 start_codon:yes stop_codon:yes gene_type:complete